MDTEKVVIFDAHALIHRAFHALPPLTTSDGTPINAVFGFIKLLLKVIKKMDPQYVVVAFDSRVPTFRHIEYDQYKGKRPPAPVELKKQFPIVRQLVQELDLKAFEVPGYEADDIIGTLVNIFKRNDKNEIIIVTGDWDTAQLVTNDSIKIYTLKKNINDTVLYSVEDIKERFGLLPEQIVDYKALKGDTSDNIPGVKGIGDKTAVLLLQKYKNLDTIYNSLDLIDEKTRKKLIAEKDKAYLSKKLATIDQNMDLSVDESDCQWEGFNLEKLFQVLEKYEFYSLKKEFQDNNKKKISDGQLELV